MRYVFVYTEWRGEQYDLYKLAKDVPRVGDTVAVTNLLGVTEYCRVISAVQEDPSRVRLTLEPRTGATDPIVLAPGLLDESYEAANRVTS